MNNKISIFLLAFPFLIVACEDPHHDLATPRPIRQAIEDERTLEKALGEPISIALTDVDQFVFKNHCIGCHGPQLVKDRVSLENLDNMAGENGFKKVLIPFDPEGSSLYQSLKAKGRRHMPPLDSEVDQLTDEQIELVYQWILNGAQKDIPETGTGRPIVEKPPSLKEQLEPYFQSPETVDYKVMQKYLLKDLCMNCHTYPDNYDSLPFEEQDYYFEAIEYGANMSSYNTLVNGDTIKMGKHKESTAYESIAIDQSMPPQEEGYSPVDPYLVKLMRLWILNCSIEDYDKLKDEELSSNPDVPEKVRVCDSQ